MIDRPTMAGLLDTTRSALAVEDASGSFERMTAMRSSGHHGHSAVSVPDKGSPLCLDAVSKRYPGNDSGIDVLEDLSFTVADREFVVLLGPSGCGKTTLLKILAGLIEPTTGEVTRNGSPITGPNSDIAMVFQDFVLLPWQTVLENVMLGQKVQNGVKTSQRRDVAMHWIEKVGLDGFEHRYPKELSGGMKQRVGLARALSVDPEVLLMDEPFGSLDAQTRDRLQTELLEMWNGERKTILFVTHDIDEAIYLGDRVMVLSEKPAIIKASISVDIERPRWNRRLDIEQSDEFRRIKERLRAELGLVPV